MPCITPMAAGSPPVAVGSPLEGVGSLLGDLGPPSLAAMPPVCIHTCVKIIANAVCLQLVH